MLVSERKIDIKPYKEKAMGYLATILVDMDNLEDMERDPKFGEKLRSAIQEKALHRHRTPEVRGERGRVARIVSIDHTHDETFIRVEGNRAHVVPLEFGMSEFFSMKENEHSA